METTEQYQPPVDWRSVNRAADQLDAAGEQLVRSVPKAVFISLPHELHPALAAVAGAKRKLDELALDLRNLAGGYTTGSGKF